MIPIRELNRQESFVGCKHSIKKKMVTFVSNSNSEKRSISPRTKFCPISSESHYRPAPYDDQKRNGCCFPTRWRYRRMENFPRALPFFQCKISLYAVVFPPPYLVLFTNVYPWWIEKSWTLLQHSRLLPTPALCSQ